VGDALEQLKGAGTSAIGGIGNAGSSLISGIANPGPKTQTAEELLGVLGLLGSSYLKARSLNGSSYIGDPLGIASAGLLSNGLYAGDRNNEESRQKKLAQIIMGALPSKEGAAGPDEPEGSVLGSLIGSGEKPSEALDITKALYPAPKEYEPEKFVDKSGKIVWKSPGQDVTGLQPYSAPKEPKPTEQQKLDFYEKERKIAQKYQRPLETPTQKQADAEARTTGTFNALSKLPITRWNPRVTALSTDGSLKLLPGATEADIDSGKALPVLTTDIKQLRQAQTAAVTLDDLDKTIDGALPVDPGVISASGMLGRKITEVVNPTKLARFNAARLGAADAFIRAITQRGNKAQFDAAMNNIVGPNATVASAKQGIAQARKIIDDLTNELTGNASSSLRGAALGAVPGAEAPPPGEEPPPPPDYE
jgi:hypothetical protein